MAAGAGAAHDLGTTDERAGGRAERKQSNQDESRAVHHCAEEPAGANFVNEQQDVMICSSGIHRRIPNTVVMARMLVLFALAATLTGLTSLSRPALAAPDDDQACLSKAEQRAALSNGQTVTLAAAIRSVRGSVRGRGTREVVKARLCREHNGLVYLLTLLTRDGKVTHTAVDATSGKVVDAR
jgi:uncharacterized membrane protein YkoI